MLQGLAKLPKGHEAAAKEITALQSKIDDIVADAKAPLDQRLAVLPLLASRKWAAVEPVMKTLLVARSELQRRDLASSAGEVSYSLRKVDAAVGVARRAATHPLLLTGAVAAVVVIIRPRRLLQGLTLGLSAAVAVQRASALLRTSA